MSFDLAYIRGKLSSVPKLLPLILSIILFAAYPLIPGERNPAHTIVFLSVLLPHIVLAAYTIKNCKAVLNLKIVLIAFFLARALSLPTWPWLSDDVYTYLWQGSLTLAGENVYTGTPTSEKWEKYKGEYFSYMGNVKMPAIYPPLTILTYTLPVIVSKSLSVQLFIWKLILLASESLGFIFLLKALRLRGLGYVPALAYAILPLGPLEIAGQGHNEGLIAAPLGALIWMAAKFSASDSPSSRRIMSLLVSALALIKVLPGLLLVPVLKLKSSWKGRIISIVVCALPIILLSIPFFMNSEAIRVLAKGQAYYSNKAVFNSPPLYFFRKLFSVLEISRWAELAPKYLNLTRLILIGAIALTFKSKDYKGFIRHSTALYLTVILFSSKVHSWYFIPICMLSLAGGNTSLPIALQAMLFSYYVYALHPAGIVQSVDLLIWLASGGIFLLLGRKSGEPGSPDPLNISGR